MDKATEGDSASAVSLGFGYTGRTRRLVALSLKIFVFTIVTLTLYRFWGRTEVRRYLWSNIAFNGEQLDYDGRGRELFLGFLLAVFVFILPLIVAARAAELLLPTGSPEQFAAYGAIQITFVFLIGAGIYQAWRYRLSRTELRGIRMSLKGSASLYAVRFILLNGLNILFLGWLTPVIDLSLMRAIARNAWFGDRRFKFEAKARQLYGPFALSYFLGVALVIAVFIGIGALMPGNLEAMGQEGLSPEELGHIIPYVAGAFVLGAIMVALSSVFYMERRLRVIGSAFRLEGLKFTLDAHFVGYLRLRVGNLLITFLTLGFGIPIAEHRTFRYIFRRLQTTGTLDLDHVAQTTGPRPRLGEGLAEAFGLGNV